MLKKSKVHEVRREKKRSLFSREISSLIQKISSDEHALQNVHITRVELSSDLSICYVYFSAFGDKADFDKALEVLKLYKPSMRSVLAKGLRLRYAPDLIFLYDDKQEKVRRVEGLIKKIQDELKEIDEE